MLTLTTNQIETTPSIIQTTGSQLPTRPSNKRKASVMLAASDEANPQVGRSVRPRIRYTTETAVADANAFGHIMKAMAESTMNSIPISVENDEDDKAADAKAELMGFLSSFMVGIEALTDRLLEIANRKE